MWVLQISRAYIYLIVKSKFTQMFWKVEQFESCVAFRVLLESQEATRFV